MSSVFVHGFLGLPDDWSQAVHLKDAQYFSIWDSMRAIQSEITFSSWADHFLKTTAKGIAAYGYSLGGRLLLHAFQKNPAHFSSLHLFATNYGLDSETEKKARIANDQKWAERFRNENWKTLLHDWNQQSVFQGSLEPDRHEKDFDRKLLATALDAFSLGRQENLKSVIENASVPVRYVVGLKDSKFAALADAIKQTQNVHVSLIPEVGHRILFDPKAQVYLLGIGE